MKKIKELLSKESANKNDKDDSEKIKRIIDIINTEKEENNKINLVHKELGKNNIEEIKDIIESINRIQADIGKILLLGGAGVGKTTLLHNISYKWGKGQLWNDKFDYVFRVKLKELLNESWSREYEPSELRQDKVGCFIHYCLTHSAKFSKSEKIQLLKDIARP
ncbi:NACHT domain-containing protein [Rickettsia endosymbiont of Ixodes pacificus]|uniref:NACHT domain-containing protein n=1 Tax=Rickettsia endosymbiont of Ixodes pacificus TaxID=1133329 RepID=UPI0009E4D113